ncbi:MAG: Do family serine endopeptidase [Planctomycetota bacterium]|nr:Do family serine endopeptidase [Planctomycetota bacterium]MDA1211352.1 Do family serine endopeptidase [Planctomycetota bacterium]
MTTLKRNSHWMVLLLGTVCLVGAAGVWAQRDEGLKPSPMQHAQDLSSAFRQVVESSLPCIVSIQTRGKSIAVNGGNPFPFGDDSPFGELFKNDPRFREFMKQAPQQRRQVPMGMGSGFVIDSSGIIMTNTHVVQNAEVVTVRLHDGREYVAHDIKTDPKSDVAIIHIDAPGDLKALPLGDSNDVQIADWVLAIGSPFGLDLSVTAGIISAKGRGPGINEQEDYLQTDAAINPGNSGGPLINIHGEVIGVNTAISTRSGGYDGVGFAIPVNLAKWVSDQLIEKGQVDRAYLGVGIQELDNKLAKSYGLPVGKGVVVSQIMPGSPAEDAKLQPGDVILSLNSKDIRGASHLQGLVVQMDVGKPYPMTIFREGKEQEMQITFKPMPKEYSLRGGVNPVEPEAVEETKSEKYDNLGIKVAELIPELAQKYGFEESQKGVVVTSVEEGSPAETAGLSEGVIISKVGDSSIATLEEFHNAVKTQSPEKGVRLLVRTQRGPRFVVIFDDAEKQDK